MTARAVVLSAVAVAICALAVSPARASDAARAAIEAALVQWKDDFNAGRADRVCDLFSRDLRVDFRGLPERGYDAQCALLKRALADPAKTFSYALSIKEILVWGDTAIVRLVWTSTLRRRDGGGDLVTVEPGMDVFRREADGRWRIVRYMAFEQ